ncbi:MAG: hypothetical protein ACRDD1_13045, partial [Planctomycetia bacterium]
MITPPDLEPSIFQPPERPPVAEPTVDETAVAAPSMLLIGGGVGVALAATVGALIFFGPTGKPTPSRKPAAVVEKSALAAVAELSPRLDALENKLNVASAAETAVVNEADYESAMELRSLLMKARRSEAGAKSKAAEVEAELQSIRRAVQAATQAAAKADDGDFPAGFESSLSSAETRLDEMEERNRDLQSASDFGPTAEERLQLLEEAGSGRGSSHSPSKLAAVRTLSNDPRPKLRAFASRVLLSTGDADALRQATLDLAADKVPEAFTVEVVDALLRYGDAAATDVVRERLLQSESLTAAASKALLTAAVAKNPVAWRSLLPQLLTQAKNSAEASTLFSALAAAAKKSPSSDAAEVAAVRGAVT